MALTMGRKNATRLEAKRSRKKASTARSTVWSNGSSPFVCNKSDQRGVGVAKSLLNDQQNASRGKTFTTEDTKEHGGKPFEACAKKDLLKNPRHDLAMKGGEPTQSTRLDLPLISG
jgi:hypothetical protein